MTYACAFCGEENDVLEPLTGTRQTFTEDCAVCCRPNLIRIAVDRDGDVLIEATLEYGVSVGSRWASIDHSLGRDPCYDAALLDQASRGGPEPCPLQRG